MFFSLFVTPKDFFQKSGFVNFALLTLMVLQLHAKQDKYTMDPGPQIYLSNNINKFWSKIIFELQKQKYISEKNFFSEKIWKNKIWEKKFFEKNLKTIF